MTARIEAFHELIRQARTQELSIEEQAGLCKIIDALRPVVCEQDFAPAHQGTVSSLRQNSQNQHEVDVSAELQG